MSNLPSSYFSVPGNVQDSSTYLKEKKSSEIYIGENKNKKKYKKKFYNKNDVISYNLGKAMILNYPASTNNVIIYSGSIFRLVDKNNINK